MNKETRAFISFEFEGDGRPIINMEFKNGILVSKDIGDSGHNCGMASEFTFYARGFEAGIKNCGMGDLVDVLRESYYVATVEEGKRAKEYLSNKGLWDKDMEEWLNDSIDYELEYKVGV